MVAVGMLADAEAGRTVDASGLYVSPGFIDIHSHADDGSTRVATASDGGIAHPDDGPVHPRFYGTFPRKIRRYVLETGVLSLEDAVRAQTTLPARIMGLADRGHVRESAWADLVAEAAASVPSPSVPSPDRARAVREQRPDP